MAKRTTIKCPKCSGKGHLNAFAHYAGGVCFTCEGRGAVTVKVASEAEKAARVAKRAAEAAMIAERNARILAEFAHLIPASIPELYRISYALDLARRAA